MTPSEEVGFFYFAAGVILLFCAAFAPGLLRLWEGHWFFAYRASRGSFVVVAWSCIALGLAKLGVVPAVWHGLLAVAVVFSLVVAALIDLPDDDPAPKRRARTKNR